MSAALDAAIRAACPYFVWYDDPRPIGKLKDAPQNHPCHSCKDNDGPHGGTGGCRLLTRRMMEAGIHAFIEHPDIAISWECRQTLRAHLES